MEHDWIKDTLQVNGTLKNKLGITDAQELAKQEYLQSTIKTIRLLRGKPTIKSIADLKTIHYLLFKDLYDWAGKYRPGNFQKGTHVFFERSRFPFAEEYLNGLVKQANKKQSLTALDYAKLLDNTNDFHPFREGNGRSTRAFLECLAADHGQVISYPRHNDRMIKAENDSDLKAIASLIKVENTPGREAAFKQQILAKRAALRRKRGLER